MQINPKTFCTAPWFHVWNSNLGNYAACCQIQHELSEFDGQKEYKWPDTDVKTWLDSPYLTYLRKELTEGNQLPECDKCWKKERYGEISRRNRYNAIEQPWMKLYFQKKNDYKQDLISQADVRLTNLCNFSCAMCNPGDSSKIYTAWKQDQNNEWVSLQLVHRPTYLEDVRTAFIEKNNHVLLQEIIDCKPKNISLLGGEPLLDTTALEILKNISEDQKQKTNLSFMTNGSVDLNQTVEYLGNFKNIKFNISIEGIGAIQEWVRKGSNWSQIENNINLFLDKHSKNNISVHHTVQALTISRLHELLSWCAKKEIDFKYAMVGDLESLTLKALPESIKNQAVESLNNLKILLNYETDNGVLQPSTPQNLSNLVNDIKYDHELFEELRKFFAWYDPNDTWKNVIPEWIPFIES